MSEDKYIDTPVLFIERNIIAREGEAIQLSIIKRILKISLPLLSFPGRILLVSENYRLQLSLVYPQSAEMGRC